MDTNLDAITKFAKDTFGESTQKKYWEHTKRVLAYSKLIGLQENANMSILLPAALLHDVGMTIDSSFAGHVIKSKMLANEILTINGYNKSDIELILKIIGSHHPIPGSDLKTIEEQILYDADNMEIIGVLGTLRWFGHFPETLEKLESSSDLFLNMVYKCIESRGSLFYTKTAQHLANNTVDSTIKYHEKLKSQIKQFADNTDNIFPISF